MWGFGVFTAASLACALAPNSTVLISARAMQGIGAAFLVPNSLGIARGASYWTLGGQLFAIGAGLGLLVPALTSAILGSVEKARSGIAAGILNATRQTGSVIGVALFRSLVGREDAFISGVRTELIISVILLIGAALLIALGARTSPHEP